MRITFRQAKRRTVLYWFLNFFILIYILKNFIKSVNESIKIQETEKQCRSCKYFEECDECFVKNCPDYIKAKPDDFDEDF